MRNPLSLLIFATLLGLQTIGASAQSRNPELSYTWLEADYLNLDVDDFDDDEDLIDDWDDGDGWGVRGSFAFTPNFFGFAGYSETDSDASFTDDEMRRVSNSSELPQ